MIQHTKTITDNKQRNYSNTNELTKCRTMEHKMQSGVAYLQEELDHSLEE